LFSAKGLISAQANEGMLLAGSQIELSAGGLRDGSAGFYDACVL